MAAIAQSGLPRSATITGPGQRQRGSGQRLPSGGVAVSGAWTLEAPRQFDLVASYTLVSRPRPRHEESCPARLDGGTRCAPGWSQGRGRLKHQVRLI
jgi:hypothetical protein